MNPYETLYQARFAARYGARYNQLAARAWGKLALITSGLELLGGSAAFAAYLSNNGALSAAVGLLLAFCVTLNHTLRPAEKHKDETLLQQRFMRLIATPNLTLDDLNHQLGELCSEPDHGFDCLKNRAYNDVAREFGRDDYLIRLSALQRLATLL